MRLLTILATVALLLASNLSILTRLQDQKWESTVLARSANLAAARAEDKKLEGLSAVSLAVGQAYETWWSLSRAGPNNDYVQPENYRTGAETARQNAIRIYEQVTSLAPASLEAAYAKRELPCLKL